jgi:vanillate O-demethylase ferredoxin subunit
MRSDSAWTGGKIHASRVLTPTITMFEISPDHGGATWSPGSHIDIAVTIDGRAELRSY